jgi:hypothetical protein
LVTIGLVIRRSALVERCPFDDDGRAIRWQRDSIDGRSANYTPGCAVGYEDIDFRILSALGSIPFALMTGMGTRLILRVIADASKSQLVRIMDLVFFVMDSLKDSENPLYYIRKDVG